jgi:hypothetical protein
MDELQTLRTAVEAAKEVPAKPVMGGCAPSYLSVARAWHVPASVSGELPQYDRPPRRPVPRCNHERPRRQSAQD